MQTETLVRLPGLHEGQRLVDSGRKRFNVLACGRRWGKSKYLTRRIAVCVLQERNYGYFAARYKLIQEVWDELHSRIGHVAKFEVTKNRIKFGNGQAEFWTLEDEDAGRSRRYHEVGIDEGGLVRNLGKKWNEAVRPTLADFKGTADFAGTPKGRGFFWEAYTYGQDDLNDEWASWQMPTSTNPYIDPAEIEAARNGMPDRAFRQEFLAEFLEDAGGVFRGVSLVVDDGRKDDEPPQEGKQYQAGVDLARTEDFTVISVFETTGRQVYHERFNQISWERQVSAIETVAKRYKCPVVMDTTGLGDPIYERVRKLGVNVRPYHFTNTTKEALIDNAAMMIEQGKCRLMDIQVQTDELTAYQYELTPSRKVTMSAPEGMHDDCVISVALALWGLESSGGRLAFAV